MCLLLCTLTRQRNSARLVKSIQGQFGNFGTSAYSVFFMSVRWSQRCPFMGTAGERVLNGHLLKCDPPVLLLPLVPSWAHQSPGKLRASQFPLPLVDRNHPYVNRDRRKIHGAWIDWQQRLFHTLLLFKRFRVSYFGHKKPYHACSQTASPVSRNSQHQKRKKIGNCFTLKRGFMK